MSSTEGSTEVRVFKPKAIILGFHGTIAPTDWEEKCFVPYIREHLLEYLRQNWSKNSVSQLIPKLKQESFDQHFVYENTECPVIVDEESDSDNTEQINLVNDFLIWQINCGKETNESSALFRMVWIHGLDSRQIRIPLFSDVVPALKKFKDEHKLKIALFSSVAEEICFKIFGSTTEGDVNPYFDKYFDKNTGSSKDKESYKKIAQQLGVETNQMLYVIDYGQSAKCAKELDIQCLLIVRPLNRRIREYYLLRFTQIQSLLDIKFV